MSTIAEFVVPPSEFSLTGLFEEFPDASVELERFVPTNESLVPYFWVYGVDSERVTTAFEELGGVMAAVVVDEVGDAVLVKARWDPSSDGLVGTLVDADVVVLSAKGTADGWRFEVRGDDSSAVRTFQENCRAHGIRISLNRIHRTDASDPFDEYGLTDAQREALVLAHRRGYFESPRRGSLDTIAQELGITGQSLGSRIRRGLDCLVANTLATETERD